MTQGGKSETGTPPTEILSTGAVRQKTAGRGCYELLSPFVLERDAKLYEWGVSKRGYRNWEKGMPFSRCIQSLFRHLKQYMAGETDPDHGDPLAAIRFWAAALMHYEEMISRHRLPDELDDRPDYAEYEEPGEFPKLHIYVAGPITAPTKEGVLANYKRGQEIARELEKKGHVVFCPHDSVLEDWDKPTYEKLLELDLSIIDYWADALYYIAPSPGADRELKAAQKNGLVIFRSLNEVPQV